MAGRGIFYKGCCDVISWNYHVEAMISRIMEEWHAEIVEYGFDNPY